MPFFLLGKFLNIYTEGVIPVLDTGIQFLLYSYLVYLFKIKFSGSQCQSTGMTPFLAEIILKSQCSYSCGMNCGMT
uniref:hypothetical protein n=1 Tax=Wolbachia pipientis TaxID=955 RepID=UPI002873E15C|nr:hypothetical protein [Wolbachia pipientis]